MQEEWRDVVGYEGLFQISNHGRFFSKRSGKVLKLNRTGSCEQGYLAFVTKVGGRKGRSLMFKAHQEVAKAFLEEPSEGLVRWAKNTHYGVVLINHIDGDKHNNSYTNLEWCTNSENLKHYHENLKETPTKPRNGCNPSLKDEEVLQIRDLSKYGFSERAIAKMYSVSRSSVNSAKNGYRWVS